MPPETITPTRFAGAGEALEYHGRSHRGALGCTSCYALHDGGVARQAQRYSDVRMSLAGDAAHLPTPPGGQVLNVGETGSGEPSRKPAITLRSNASEAVLDSDESGVLLVGARVLQTSGHRPPYNSPACRWGLARRSRCPARWDVVRHRLGLVIAALDIRFAGRCGIDCERSPAPTNRVCSTQAAMPLPVPAFHGTAGEFVNPTDQNTEPCCHGLLSCHDADGAFDDDRVGGVFHSLNTRAKCITRQQQGSFCARRWSTRLTHSQ
ncbi:FAD-dependent monooxygenase [Nocardia brasiliensis]